MSDGLDDTTGNVYSKAALLPTATANAGHASLKAVFASLPKKIKLFSETEKDSGGYNQVFNIEVMGNDRPHESRVLAGKSVTVIGTPYDDYYDDSVVPATQWQPDLFMRSSHVYFKQDSLYDPDTNGKFTDFSEGVQTAEQIKQLNETLSLQECVKHFKEKLVGAEPMIFDGGATEIYGGFTDFRAAALDMDTRMQEVLSLSETNQSDLATEAATRKEKDDALGVRIDLLLTNTDATALDSLAEIVAEFRADDGDLTTAFNSLATDVRAEFVAADVAQKVVIDEEYASAIETARGVLAGDIATNATNIGTLGGRADVHDATDNEHNLRLSAIEDYITTFIMAE